MPRCGRGEGIGGAREMEDATCFGEARWEGRAAVHVSAHTSKSTIIRMASACVPFKVATKPPKAYVLYLHGHWVFRLLRGDGDEK